MAISAELPKVSYRKAMEDIYDNVNTLETLVSGISAAELGFLDAVVAGTAAASKAVVLDASKGIATITSATITTLTSTTAVLNTVRATAAQHLALDSGTTATDVAGKTVRLNSITNTGTANDLIGFQSKPAQGAATAKNVIGCEISPRVNDTFALTSTGTLIGAHIDAYLKGTTGNIGGDVRGAQIELVTDDAGTRTITGDVVGLRMRAAFSGTITGNMTAIKVEKAEAQTNSKQWEYFLELTGSNGLIWDSGYTTEAADENGSIKVRVNGADRWIKLYGTAPVV